MKTDNGDIIFPIFNGLANEIVKAVLSPEQIHEIRVRIEVKNRKHEMHQYFDPTERRGGYLNIDNKDQVSDATTVLIEQGTQIVPPEYWPKTIITKTDKMVAWEYVPDGCAPHYR